ncbi:hypothetical protein ATCC90586_005112 [Pythium insidiosum]|nr:hypothetical protein ATCC90586_005112 [Pythium insidiosum]
MSRLLRAAVQLHDGDAWRLPNWEEYSDSGRSGAAWSDADAGTECAPATTDDDADNDNDNDDGSDDDDGRSHVAHRRLFSAEAAPMRSSSRPDENEGRGRDGAAVLARAASTRRRRPSGVAISLPMHPPPSTVTSARSPATLTRMARDLRALHQRFAQQRQQDAPAEDAASTLAPSQDRCAAQQQAQIASQLEGVREQLADFQRRWQSAVEGGSGTHGVQAEAVAPSPSVDAPAKRRDFFDMAVQTDVVMSDDALLQWLHLLTQKVDVLAGSFHGDTTQLPIRYPLQPHIPGDPVPLRGSCATGTEPSSASSWHVGRSLQHLVSPATADQLLDVERAIACLATATQQTTTRYVEYFERIVSQIQEVHQQRLQQVVEESLKEMKLQRSKYKKRLELLSEECQAAKQETEKMRRHLEQLNMELQATQDRFNDADRRREAQSSELQQAKSLVEELMASLESAQRELDGTKRHATAQSASLMATLHDREATIRELQQQLTSLQAAQQIAVRRAEKELEVQRNALQHQTDVFSRQEQSLREAHKQELARLDERWRQRLQDAIDDTKRSIEQSQPSVVSQECQTDQHDDELLNDCTMPTDERIARLQRRCRALEGLLEKKFEDASVAGSVSPRSSVSSTWMAGDSHAADWRSAQRPQGAGQRQGDTTGTTLPLTSFEFSFEDLASASPSKQQWETTSRHSARSSLSSQLTVSAASQPPPSDAPSTEDMMALVRKLEHLATRPEKHRAPSQPDEEPETEPSATAPSKISRRHDDAALKRASGGTRERTDSTPMAAANAAKKRPSLPLRASFLRQLSAAAATAATDSLLVINAGSSTLKYKLFHVDPQCKSGVGKPVFAGLVELSTASSKQGRLVHQCLASQEKQELHMELPTHRVALEEAVQRFFGAQAGSIRAIGHRVVHGGEAFHDASLLTRPVLDALEANIALAPLHNPANLLGIEVATEVFGASVPQVGVFDTAFHATMEPKAFLYAVPYKLYEEHGVRRYGFHGTSHQYVAKRAAKYLGKPLEECRFVTCHLGNGSSMAAIRDGQCVDTTMGLTPLDGLCMGTRSGDVDPALHNFLATTLKMSIGDIDKMLNKQSGLLGICGDSDIRQIQDRVRKQDPADTRADLALDVYSHRVRKYLGAYLLELEGKLDAIVFTAGIGENSAMVRERVCRNLSALGIELDQEKNAVSMLGAGPIAIQSERSKVQVLVIPTDEERSIAEQTYTIALQK